MHTIFIADLHLSEDEPKLTERFLKFIDEKAKQADALYILGDLFSAWIGKDFEKSLNQLVIKTLTDLNQSGTKVFFLHGNRDFLLTKRFCKKAHCMLLPDPTLITLYNVPVLIAHGDLFCTKDEKYQNYRNKTRNRRWAQKLFLLQPLKQRKKVLAHFRQNSKNEKALKTPEMMDTDPQTIRQYLKKYHVNYLIHGHTHRPGIYRHQTAIQAVLDDWDESANAISCRPDKNPTTLLLEFIRF